MGLSKHLKDKGVPGSGRYYGSDDGTGSGDPSSFPLLSLYKLSIWIIWKSELGVLSVAMKERASE